MELVKALAKAQLRFEPVRKDKINPHFKNKYASLDAILEATRPALSANGIAVVQTLGLDGENQVLITKLLHESGDFLESVYRLPPITDPQKFGSAMTYARRYSLAALLCVAADEDDDGNTAAKPDSNCITESQVKRLFTIASEMNADKDAIKNWLKSELGIESSRAITKESYDSVISTIQSGIFTPVTPDYEGDVP